MSRDDIIRAWKDPEYRRNISKSKHNLLPENPAGIIEISDADLKSIAGGTETEDDQTCLSCTLECTYLTPVCDCTVTGDPCVLCK